MLSKKRHLHKEGNRLDGIRERERASYDSAFAQLRHYGKQAISSLKAKYQGQFRRLEEWGLHVTQNKYRQGVRTRTAGQRSGPGGGR